MAEQIDQQGFDEIEYLKFRNKWCVIAHVEANQGFYVVINLEEKNAKNLMKVALRAGFVNPVDWKFYPYRVSYEHSYDPDKDFSDEFKKTIEYTEHKNSMADDVVRKIIRDLYEGKLPFSSDEAWKTIKKHIIEII